MIFRAKKKDDERGYLIEGIAFSDDEENLSVGFVLERRNYPSGKSRTFELGTEARNLGRTVFDLFDEVFKKYGQLNKIKKVSSWIPTLAGHSFDIDLVAEWTVEEKEWKDLTREIEKELGIEK